MIKDKRWARISRLKNGGYGVQICDSKSPLANVIEEIPCGSQSSAYSALRKILKELGRTYGGERL